MCDGASEAVPNKATFGSRKGIEPSRHGPLLDSIDGQWILPSTG